MQIVNFTLTKVPNNELVSQRKRLFFESGGAGEGELDGKGGAFGQFGLEAYSAAHLFQ